MSLVMVLLAILAASSDLLFRMTPKPFLLMMIVVKATGDDVTLDRDVLHGDLLSFGLVLQLAPGDHDRGRLGVLLMDCYQSLLHRMTVLVIVDVDRASLTILDDQLTDRMLVPRII
ncbi:hypothetical protein BDK51DRAFT_44310 [Blyttiomyces helicus]|uniref:Secreted protein n=1 Tax=Blyttiomyces helicus TaxID=388810 RepID=A0A4P9WNG1_9FUNG|nr:hypothetical protein BDK51DRAFT_44310 [Blyttiomyces helicus]|eukprot:RKO93623.1 hypothetical protein BDK51DRAFT_44310 [Blyttiomyces helicus]